MLLSYIFQAEPRLTKHKFVESSVQETIQIGFSTMSILVLWKNSPKLPIGTPPTIGTILLISLRQLLAKSPNMSKYGFGVTSLGAQQPNFHDCWVKHENSRVEKNHQIISARGNRQILKCVDFETCPFLLFRIIYHSLCIF